MRLPPKMTPAQIAEAPRMAREWKPLGAPGKNRSQCALDERAAPRTGRVLCPAYGARWRSLPSWALRCLACFMRCSH
jgi:hypothetical protein